MNSIKERYTVPMPNYALGYIINDDATGIEDTDKIAIDKYMAQYYDRAKDLDAFCLVNVISTEGYFTNSPAFGLPCTAYDTDIIIFRQ